MIKTCITNTILYNVKKRELRETAPEGCCLTLSHFQAGKDIQIVKAQSLRYLNATKGLKALLHYALFHSCFFLFS